jgi:hypothetical protein
MGAPREGLGALFRALLDFVDERRVRQQVYAVVSPEPIFSNLDRFFSLITRGISFEWNRTGKSGTVTARFEGPDLPEAPLHVLRGSLQFAFEVTTTTGSVSAPEIVEATPERTTVLYRVEWR